MKQSSWTKSIRDFRKYHKYIGLALTFFVFISALTGLLLGWKKDAAILQPPTQKGSSLDLQTWRSLADLSETAQTALYQSFPEQMGNPIDRMDVRPDKGIVKVTFKEGWWEVQVDGTTGEVLSIARRHSDWIEQLHDGSLIGDTFKLIAMNALGVGLILMLLTGLWLWYGPRRLRQMKRKR